VTAAAEDRDRVGPYRVIKPIGAGGSARIDLARIDRAYGFQRHVVIKRPLEHLRGDPRVIASLRREARIGGVLRHPNLVAILDAGVHDGTDYLALEYVHGAALREVMQGVAPGQVRDLPLGVALAIVADAARGMHEAHELADDAGAPLGLVHRDVSPGNLLLGLDGAVKLADFGIAVETRVATLSGSLRGTVTYMAPEQCQGHAFDRRADVFSLGVILYELVTATRLFWADNDVASLHRVLSGAVPRPREIKPQLPAALEDIVLTAVAHDPARRFATALELAVAIERYATSAGEVLSARRIAAAVASAIGARPVPWIAAEQGAIPAAAEPAADGSLVELIAASSADEPVEAGFGEADDAGDGDDGPGDAGEPIAVSDIGDRTAVRADGARDASEAITSSRTAGHAPASATVPRRRRRRRRAWIAGFAGITALGAAAVIAVVAAREPARETAAARAAESPRPVAVHDAVVEPPVPPAVATPADPPPRASDVPAVIDTAAIHEPSATSGERAQLRGSGPPDATRAPVKRRRPPSKSPRDAAVPAASTAARADATTPAAAPAPPGTAAVSAPPTEPPAKVEWKPTLLLPTDGSDGRARK
jgi:serine/threonine-protein kinase